MRLIAHRGFRSAYPENTIPAAEAAASVADGIELDVRRCQSGELVVIHDEVVDRVTDSNGAVRDHTRSELEALDVLETGRGVPTLRETLRTIPDSVGVNVELKEWGTEADTIELLESEHSQAIISSFSRDILESCQAIDSSIPRAYITDESETTAVDTAIELGCEYLHPSKEICSDRMVADAHRAGMSVTAWSIDTAAETEPLDRIGVDGVIANRPDVLAEPMV